MAANPEWSANKPDGRATAVWDRLLGCFGDALLRKFGAEPPQEWVGAIKSLRDPQIERGLRRLLFGWKGPPPSLPDFMRLCRSVGTDEFDEDNSDQLRIAKEDSFRGDIWDMAANRYLMGHIAKRLAATANFYGKPASVSLLRAPAKDLQDLGIDPHYLDASGQMVTQIIKLVAAKKEWAADMRDLAVKGEVPVEQQQAIWRDYISRAEAS